MTLRSDSTRRSIRPLHIVVGFVAMLALLAACSAPAPVPGIDIGPSTNAPTVLRGTSVDVDVVLTRSGGATGPIALSATGLPSGVTASFAPTSLDGAATTSVLTLSASAAAIDGTTSVTITADGASLTDTATLTLTVDSVAIAGRVVQFHDLPMVGVAVSSQGEATFTDAEGAFELDGLAMPYDLTLTSAVGSGGVHVYEGLTTTAPVITPTFATTLGLPTPKQAMVSGTVLGGAAVGADRIVIVCAEGLDLVVIGCDYVGSGETTYQIEPNWYETPLTTVHVHALHVEFAGDNTPTAFLGYETFDLPLANGDAEARDLALAPVSSMVVEGSIVAADGMGITTVFGSVRFGPRLSMLNFQSASVAGDVSFLVPTPAGATYDVTAAATGPNGPSFAWIVDQSGDFGTLTVPAPLALGTPADAAADVTLATPFTSSSSDEVRTYLFAGAGPMLAITTTRASVTVPNPSLGGFAYPTGAAYTWYAFGHGSTDPDAALSRSLLDYSKLVLLPFSGGPGYDQNGVLGFGTDRDFTFAP